MIVRALRNRSFRLLWTANALSGLGSHVSRMALILFLFDRPGDGGRSIALLLLISAASTITFAPLAGAVIDRHDKRTVMIAAEIVRLLTIAWIALDPAILTIYLATAIHSVATVFFEPARNASVPLVVEKESLPHANGLDQSATGLMLIAGPVVGAELYAAAGLLPTLLFDMATFAAGAVLIAMTGPVPRLAESETRGTAASIREGWQYMSAHRDPLQVIALILISVFCVEMWVPVAPVFLRQWSESGERVLGLQFGLFGLGMLIGGALGPLAIRVAGRGRIFFTGLCLEALLLVAYSQAQAVASSMAICMVWGVSISLALVAYYLLIQGLVAAEFLGRVFATARQGENVAMTGAMLLAVLVVQRIPPQQILLGAGLIYVSIVALSVMTPRGSRLLGTR